MPLIDLNGLGHFKDKENAMIAENFAATKNYAAGDYCYFNGTLKKFKTAHAAGAWIGTDAEDAKLAGDVSSLKESTNELKTAFDVLDEKIDIYKEFSIPNPIAPTDANGYGYETAGSSTGYKILDISSASWVIKLYAVEKDKTYHIVSTLAVQSDKVPQIGFSTSWTVGTEIEALAINKNEKVALDYTPKANGVISVLYSVGGTSKASDTVIGIQTYEFTDFQSEIDTIDNRQKATEDVQFAPISGYAISSVDGTPQNNGSCAYTTIDLTGKEYLSFTFKITNFSSNYGYGFVLSDDSWLGTHTTSTTTVTVNVPEGAKTLKISWNTAIVSKQEISALLYGSFTAAWQEIAEIKTEVDIPPYPLDLSVDMSELPSVSVVTPTPDVQDDIYALYDALVTSDPDWVEKVDTEAAATALGITAPSYLSGLPIYLYKFEPTRTNETIPASHLTVMITTGVHPNETMGIFTVYDFFNYINTNWKTDNTAAQLRTMIDFYIIPCVSPWGYEHSSRVNGNGVNLNRNFPTANWSASGSGTSDYTGASAGSEYETQIVMYYADLLKPDIFFDAHTGNMTVGGRYGCIELDQNVPKKVINFATAYAMNLVKEWIANNTDFPQYIDKSPLFNVNKANVVGEEFRWAAENITDYSFLTEESIQNDWSEGVLDPSSPEINTQRIWSENFKSVYGVLVWAIKSVSEAKTYKFETT